MGCQKTFTLTQGEAVGFTPLHTAVYVASSDKILGTSMDHIIEFNASTGAYIRDVQTPWPMVGSMHLGLVDALPYAAGHNNPAARDPEDSNYHEGYDIYPIDPTTLDLGAGLEVYKTNLGGYPMLNQNGPYQFIQVANKVFYVLPGDGEGVNIVWVKKTGFGAGVYGTDWRYASATSGIWVEQISSDGTSIFVADNYYPRVRSRNLTTMASTGYGAATYFSSSTEYAANAAKVFAVGDSKWLERIDDFAAHTSTGFDLDALVSQTGLKPIRLRYRSSDGKLYIPCQNKDGIVVFDPIAETAVWKSGFDSPVDIVFTASKAFAVQSSLVGLKEIV